MEDHFLKDFVSGPTGVPPEPWYNSAGDCIIYQTADEPFVADRVDEILTLYRSLDTGLAIGYQIKGVRAILRIFGIDELTVECKQEGKEITEVSLSVMLLAAYEQGPKTIGRRRAYADAFQSFSRNPQLPIQDIESA